MIVCSCNSIREEDIRSAVRRGASSAECAYASLGHEPQCGGCLSHADEIVLDERGRRLRLVSAKAA